MRAQLTGDDSTRNIMAQDVYELGSVFKIFSFALAMEDHTVNLDEVFPIGQGYKIGKFTIHEAEHMPATLAARDILAQSSNIGTAQIALRSGGVRQKAVPRPSWACSRRSAPNCPNMPARSIPRNWGTIETATIAFGQGISVSPLALRRLGGCGGQWRPPDHAHFHQDRRRPARRAADQARNQRSRCATCCAMW